ncbi:Salicylic acid-binding protein 2 [Acorus calamus]|uniref:Salicylic acid-binding protein 2 n=1 Tax=Acorus calamus TaxID=4465 RepID=A0AAV9DJB6_ACOCL|nr:Salicylic acid-binding protein 2 [Acorus calamus]
MRAGSLYLEELSKTPPFSKERYGSVKKAYLLCEDDKVVTKDFQMWMVLNDTVEEEEVIRGADHVAILSKPHELCHSLLEIE